jgi:osmotically inducible protein OsmC
MKKRTATAEWNGDLETGSGTIEFGEQQLRYSAGSRFGNEGGTNPEELMAAAHAGCYSMALTNLLIENGFAPQRVTTTAEVSLDEVAEGYSITRIFLSTEAMVPELSDDELQDYAETAKDTCPVSVALAGTEISVEATLCAVIPDE